MMPPSVEEAMLSWKVAEVAHFLRERDLCAAAKILENNDVNGRDLAALTSVDMQEAFRMSGFLADKVVVAREEFRQMPFANAFES